MKTKPPFFSIVIPTYNSGNKLATSLESIRLQNFTSYEVIVMDSRSVDNTPAVATRYKKQLPSLRFISEKDEGIYDAMNKAIDLADGTWLFFMGSDDSFYSPQVLWQIQQHTLVSNAKVIYGNAKIIGNTGWAEDGTIYDGPFDLPKLLNKNICHQAIFYNTRFIKEEIGYFEKRYTVTADWDFNLRAWAKKPFEFVNLTISNFVAGGLSSFGGDAAFSEDFLDNVMKYFGMDAFHPILNTPNFKRYELVLKKQKFGKKNPKSAKPLKNKALKNKLKKYIYQKVKAIYENRIGTFFFKQKGFCPCCEQDVTFISRHQWLRDYFKCGNCNSIPRERALMLSIKNEYPNWQHLKIHESSPGKRGHSVLLRKRAKDYLETQYFPNTPLGTFVNGIRCEDLEQQTFGDSVFDLVVTSDVMEHIYEPEKAFKEIYRTLKPGGAHIFSVPIINKHNATQRWANKGKDGNPEFLFEPEWHGNPVDKKGSPVTMHWGFDIVDYIKKHTGAETKIVYIDDLHYGIRAEYIEIVVMKKVL
ncbi:glycosyltransferase [Aequorivita todarodis]|uniref:glycosyltransferase n=1 Tax=Aequorivita todarodis TaxID=2036821 RepID=UPI00235098C6|nr:glycosyltransferase [Aequorivita todarodis]MDC8000592.1 glycosyltransferase [Aequorivita todarodis]